MQRSYPIRHVLDPSGFVSVLNSVTPSLSAYLGLCCQLSSCGATCQVSYKTVWKLHDHKVSKRFDKWGILALSRTHLSNTPFIYAVLQLWLTKKLACNPPVRARSYSVVYALKRSMNHAGAMQSDDLMLLIIHSHPKANSYAEYEAYSYSSWELPSCISLWLDGRVICLIWCLQWLQYALFCVPTA